MSISLRLLDSIPSAHRFLAQLTRKGYTGVAVKAINKTIMSVRSEANEIAREKRRLKKGEINRDFFQIRKARAGKTGSPNAQLLVSDRPIGLLRFVVGAKTPREQKGISIKRRKKLRVEIIPGRKTKLPKAFIAKGQNGLFNVFFRKSKSKLPLIRPSTQSLFKVLNTPTVKDRLFRFAEKRVEIELHRAFQLHVDREAAKAMGKGTLP